MAPPTEWYRGNYLISTSQSLLQPAVINAAFDSDFMPYWKALDEALLKEALSKSLCFGLYDLPSFTSQIASKAGLRQIGLARLITDELTIAYVTDVYILPEHQKKGLGGWLMECVNETLSSWPHLRRTLLVASEYGKLYEDKLGMRPLEQGKNGITLYNKAGEGSYFGD
ncbi:hypothetical protein BGZ60DRAFT_523877 [Tricladium varicosporioides]|nr:hypothetical protein BGZ60DRAFT_523877 [Hymenoscyphus varicosporioides]